MQHITVAFVKDNPEEVWEMAKQGPVEVRDGDVVVAVVVSPEEYQRLSSGRGRLGRPRRTGLMAEQFKGFDTDALLRVDVSEAFEL
ncbi:hypothetical protein CCAX7_17150 [Capsulimonas corticalis]|uniref:Uncharacterized protein n=1 Tax=Capsulimonas corticalis TaxID=2219043 RepID=A0A402D3X0_9BACT|nr:hypothetical protein [Capsulimonas corticalis]BDI29664.1 hypothetical protein CCAX7_17150 [Capsulimonas corticalis]